MAGEEVRVRAAHTTLEHLGLFDFGEARALLNERLGHVDQANAQSFELALLSSAEVAILPFFYDTERRGVLPLRQPLQVPAWAADVALAKAGCLPTLCAGATWLDTTLFTGDLNKLRLVGQLETSDDLAPFLERFDHLVATLQDLYGTHPSTRDVAERGLVRLEGAIWKAKLATILSEDARDLLTSYAHRFQLTIEASEGLSSGA